MKRTSLLEKKFITDLNDDFYHPIVLQWERDGYSLSKIKNRLKTLSDIVQSNGKDISMELYQKYYKSGTKDRLKIRYGNSRVSEYQSKLAERPKPKVVSWFTEKYWLDKGYSKHEAKSAISKIQHKNAKRRKKDSYKHFSKKLKHSLDYWTSIGYSKAEAELLREPYLNSMKNDLESMINRYGEEEGVLLYKKRVENYTKSIRENISNRKTGGYVSKESIKFFIPLYKFCRKLGIPREEIYLGVSGSREFFVRKNQKKNEGFFVDFCIPSLKIVVEYNGLFWHPRSPEEWSNPFTEYETAKVRDKLVESLCKDREFDLIVVWSDSDKTKEFDMLKEIIEERYVD